MSGAKLFLDTNIILYFLEGKSDIVEIISECDLIISFITELELLSFKTLADEEEQAIKGFVNSCQLISINKDIKKLTVELKRRYQLKLPDAIIAATAYSLNIPLLTADRQFQQVEELEVVIYEF